MPGLVIVTGGLVEIDDKGNVVRSASNADPIIIQHEGNWYSSIPSAPAYAVGVWVSDM